MQNINDKQKEDFEQLVAKMRYFQSECVHSNNCMALRNAKKYEKEVDRYLRSLTPIPQGVQTSLFDD